MSGFSFCIRPFFHKRQILPILALGRRVFSQLYILPIIRSWIGLPEKSKKDTSEAGAQYRYMHKDLSKQNELHCCSPNVMWIGKLLCPTRHNSILSRRISICCSLDIDINSCT